jgi:hypothetical protein
MYQHNDRLTKPFTKYKYIYLFIWLQCFDPYLGHRQAYIMNLKSVVQVKVFHGKRDQAWFTVLFIACKLSLPLLQAINNSVNRTRSRLA